MIKAERPTDTISGLNYIYHKKYEIRIRSNEFNNMELIWKKKLSFSLLRAYYMLYVVVTDTIIAFVVLEILKGNHAD